MTHDRPAVINGNMNVKTTLRIPEAIMELLHERSRREGRSVNEVAVRALLRGLGEPLHGEGWRVLGPLVEGPPAQACDPEELRGLRSRLGPGSRALEKELDWLRQNG